MFSKWVVILFIFVFDQGVLILFSLSSIVWIILSPVICLFSLYLCATKALTHSTPVGFRMFSFSFDSLHIYLYSNLVNHVLNKYNCKNKQNKFLEKSRKS